MEKSGTTELKFLIESALNYARHNFRPIGPLDADDLALMAVTRIVRLRKHIRCPLSYLYTAIRTIAIDASRHYAKETARMAHLEADLIDTCLIIDSPEADYDKQVRDASLLTVEEDTEPDVSTRVNAMLAELKPEFSKLLVLLADGYTYSELAQMFDLPRGTVRSRIHHARKKATEMLADLA